MANVSRTKSLMMLKLDIEKIYDHVYLSFLFVALTQFGFHSNFINRIKECVINPYYALLFNGFPTKWFMDSYGLH